MHLFEYPDLKYWFNTFSITPSDQDNLMEAVFRARFQYQNQKIISLLEAWIRVGPIGFVLVLSV